jgi:wyosine [tRNA(Phe)-imidazoG37] synthetase (radical SAM superfamily)
MTEREGAVKTPRASRGARDALGLFEAGVVEAASMVGLDQLVKEHPRTHRGSRYVYPVLARRSRGISIGINLNPDGRCNFDCTYCQIDRRSPPTVTTVDEAVLLAELDDEITRVKSGALFEEERFAAVPAPLRRLSDLALSGDGEPTTYPRFAELLEHVAALKRRRGLTGVKLVLITNATLLHRPAVQRGLAVLDANDGEVWAKLDAGTPEYFEKIDRSAVPFARILENLRDRAKVRPLVLQSMFLRLDGEAAPDAEVDAYVARVGELLAAGGQLDRVQIYTVSRAPGTTDGPHATALDIATLERIAAKLREKTGVIVETFG